jgi:autotransporter-associated beta strand protein
MKPRLYQASSCVRAFRDAIKVTGLSALFFVFTIGTTRAGSATWQGDYLDSPYLWSYEQNWSPQTVPEDPGDVATFGAGAKLRKAYVDISITPGTILFPHGASQFHIKIAANLTLLDKGIVNDSAFKQTFHVGIVDDFSFSGSASAGSNTLITIDAYLSNNGELVFDDSSTAAEATCIANGGTLGTGGYIRFFDHSRADRATLIADAGRNSDDYGALIIFYDYSQGDDARVILRGNDTAVSAGTLYVFRESDSLELKIGSLEGDGTVTLGNTDSYRPASLVVGSNNLSTTFNGVIGHDGYFYNGGGISKIGTGTLKLSGANLYKGGTTVKRGKLLIDNTTGSGTGTGPVTVEGGTLGGTGIIAGAVTVGDSDGNGATLAPGESQNIATPLTIQGQLSLQPDATIFVRLNSDASDVASVVAREADDKRRAIHNRGYRVDSVIAGNQLYDCQ